MSEEEGQEGVKEEKEEERNHCGCEHGLAVSKE